MTWVINIGACLLAFIFMEFVAWSAHKYIMHGALWVLHRDHHRKDHDNVVERNDAFFLIFALPAVILFLVGAAHGIADVRIWIGTGITLYGLAYFLVHDVFIHQRAKWSRRTDNRYFRAIRRAHKMHHKHLGREDGECFGMLLVPRRYLREAKHPG
ncbi:MAG TPA: sterol desaturase family protein [Flavobacteriales bacterium]|nr:sterol desaturase family protein [Flavobacteriales bacterium]